MNMVMRPSLTKNSIIPILQEKKLRLGQIKDLAKIPKDQGGNTAWIHSVCAQTHQAA